MAVEPVVVQAIYSFKGSNNDELCFKKGDIITVTQKDEEWWEGTFNDKTGWFPSNYVKECKDAPKPVVPQQNQYKSVVLKDLIDSEKAHVTELEGLVTNFLQPLEKSTILTSDEYKQLTGNINEVLETHQQLLMLIEAEATKPGPEQMVGKLFLNWAPKIKAVHQLYCSLHPRAVCILDKYKDELTKYMESRGAATPGVLVLTTMLSKPFRRLDKYSNMLQELERHVEEFHSDRGDTQRSVSVYKEIATACLATRRQKELELQVLTGPVRGWEGPSLTTLGDIIYMGSVALGPQHHDRYFVLFPTTLVILSVSHRFSAFIYEGKLFLAGLNVTRLEDSEQYKNAFELSAPMIDKRIVICQSRNEADHWIELLTSYMPRNSTTSTNVSTGSGGGHQKAQLQIVVPHSSAQPAPLTAQQHQPPPTPPAHRQGGGIITSMVRSTPTPPPHAVPNTASIISAVSSTNNANTSRSNWSAVCLRPTPPLRPCLAIGATPNGPYARYSRRPTSYKEDGMILEVIEAYCSVVKPRSTINSVDILTGGNVQMHDKLLFSNNTSTSSNAVASNHNSNCSITTSTTTTTNSYHCEKNALGRSSSAAAMVQQPLMHPHHYRPHGGTPRASTWCCGNFVVKQLLKKTQHLE